MRRSYTFIQKKIRKENEEQQLKINNLEAKLEEKEELIQLNDGKITSMELESINLKQKLKQYSVFLKNAVTENDQLQTKSTSSVDLSTLTKLNNENNELAKKLKSSKEVIRERNREIERLKIQKNDLTKTLSVAQNKVIKFDMDKT